MLAFNSDTSNIIGVLSVQSRRLPCGTNFYTLKGKFCLFVWLVGSLVFVAIETGSVTWVGLELTTYISIAPSCGLVPLVSKR